MGQYFRVYNLTKKESITPHALNDGAKLLEFQNTLTALSVLLANSNGRGGGDLIVDHPRNKKTYEREPTLESQAMQDAVDAIAGRWAGDKIVLQGDYAKKGDPAFITEARMKDFTCINDLVRAGLEADEYLRTALTKGYFMRHVWVKPGSAEDKAFMKAVGIES